MPPEISEPRYGGATVLARYLGEGDLVLWKIVPHGRHGERVWQHGSMTCTWSCLTDVQLPKPVLHEYP